MKGTVGFILFLAVVLLILVVISSGNKVPLIPADETHSIVTSDLACAGCHGPGKIASLKPSHPPKEQCLVCHKRKKKTV